MPRILVVDDDKQVLHVLTEYLEKSGHEVSPVLSGPLALASYATFHPDLVLLDLLMPGMNGMVVLRRLREYNPDLPVVVLTAVADETIAREAIDEGARDYITKPIQWEQLETLLEVYLLLSETQM